MPHDSAPLIGVVFDLDGTLVLSHHDFGKMQNEIIRAAGRYGAITPRLRVTERIGTSQILRSARLELKAAHVPEDVLSRFETEVNGLIDGIEMEAVPRVTARTGAQPLLENLRGRGLRLGLLTRSSRGFCRAALAHTGLAEFLTYIRTRSEAGPAKPSPEALRHLLREMNVPAEQAVFIGDHIEDAECAVRTGVRFYGVLPDPDQPNPTSAGQLIAAGAVAVVATLGEIADHLDAELSATRR